MKEDNKKTVAVVVTYNRKELLKECIEHLLNQKDEKCDVLIIDNKSTDGTEQYISEFIESKKIMYINTGENLGGAGGFNYGIREACKLGYEYLWVMDDDCMPHEEALKEIFNADKKLNGNYGFLSSKVLWKDNQICKMNVQRKTLFRTIKEFDGDLQKITMASFVSFFVKAEIVKELGLPIKEFFIWTDDWEYTRRISRLYNCYYVPSSVVTHKSKNNIGANITNDTEDRIGRYKYIYRNDYYLYSREGIKGKLYYYMRNTYNKIMILLSKCADKKKRIKIINDAVKDGKSFNPQIEQVD